MKSLFILRHGKSDWNADYGGDHERPLAKRGLKAARVIGRFLAGVGESPDQIVSSTARRAHDTARLAAEEGGFDCPLSTTRRLYDASPQEVIKLVSELDDGSDSVLLAGHEPTSSLVVGGLIGGANLRFPTAALARVDLAIHRWHDVDFGLGTLIWFVTPRQIGRFL